MKKKGVFELALLKGGILLPIPIFLLFNFIFAEEITIKVQRTYEGDDCTVGQMWISGAPVCQTLEPPWRHNEPDISCIPPGEYKAFVRKKKSGWRIQLEDVPGRTAVQIHKGKDLSNTIGCILVAKKIDLGTGLVEGGNEAFGEIELAFQGRGNYPLSSLPITLVIKGEKGSSVRTEK